MGTGLMIPVLVRGDWWRLNGSCFAIGTVAGMIAAVIQKAAFPWAPEYFQFLFVSGASLVFMIAGTYFTPATPKQVLADFYKRTRPFGFWSDIKNAIPASALAQVKAENRRDRISTALAVPFQLVLFLTTMSIVFKRWDNVLFLGILLAGLAVGLYYFWFRHLSAEVKIENE